MTGSKAVVSKLHFSAKRDETQLMLCQLNDFVISTGCVNIFFQSDIQGL